MEDDGDFHSPARSITNHTFPDVMTQRAKALLSFLTHFAFASAHAQVDASHSLFTSVLRDHVHNGVVDYSAIRSDSRFDRYLESLRKTNPTAIGDMKERLAFWINAYNAFTIKLINDYYPVKSIRDIKRGDTGPWDIVWVDIGGKTYSLNQIEHDIVRKEFEEPRIHMALVCAAVSCPPLRSEAYTGTTLDRQLDDNGRIFLGDLEKNRYDAEKDILYLSEIFNWYGSDFNAKYGSHVQYALQVMRLDEVKPSEVKYVSYNWSLNGR
jgi:hypothetical protein